MKYKDNKVSKVSPMAGRFTSLTAQVISTVDSPANLENWLVKKGIDNTMDDEQLKAAGLSNAAIEKAVADLPAEQKEVAKKGFFDVFKGLMKSKNEPAKSEPLTAELISKAVQDGIKEGLAQAGVKKNEAPPTEPTNQLEGELTPEQKLANVEAEIEKEKAAIAKQSNIEKRLADKEAELEEVKKMRTGGNSVYKSNQEQQRLILSDEEIAKSELDKVFEGSVFYR